MQKNQNPQKTSRDTPLRRRNALGYMGGMGLAMGATLFTLPSAALAQAYPSRPLRMIVAFPPAGATDILARLIAQGMSNALGQTVIVENKPGPGGMIGLDAGAKSQPDGYNILFCAVTNQAIATHLYPKAPSDITRDFEPISLIANGAHILNVHPSVPAKNFAEFAAWLKANDGQVNYASQGNGTLSHLESELLQQRLGIKAVHVPYRGSSQALVDLISGKLSFMFDSVAASQPFIKTGQLRPLAVATSKRTPAFPDLPTVAEAGLTGYDADNWFGVFAPKGTPREVLVRLNQVLEKVLTDTALIENLQQKGYVVTPGDSQKLASVTASDRSKWGSVIKTANISL
ncbi:MAG: tripartite tricarboxylate transporter substrate binding protein [Polaromonas sp.]